MFSNIPGMYGQASIQSPKRNSFCLSDDSSSLDSSFNQVLLVLLHSSSGKLIHGSTVKSQGFFVGLTSNLLIDTFKTGVSSKWIDVQRNLL